MGADTGARRRGHRSTARPGWAHWRSPDPSTLDARTIGPYAALDPDRPLLHPAPLENPADILAFLEERAPGS